MGGFFGAVSKNDTVLDVFFGTDYHSHLGTRRGGMAAYDKEIGLQRTIHNIEIKKEGNIVSISITGNGFLYNMVRIIAGTLMEVGRGNLQPEQMREILENLLLYMIRINSRKRIL